MTTLEKTRRTISKLENEVKQLRSFVIGMAGKDPEGEYRAEFVKRVKKAALEKPTFTYTSPGSFLKLIRKKTK